MKNKTLIIILVCLVVASIVIYLVRRNKNKYDSKAYIDTKGTLTPGGIAPEIPVTGRI